MLDLILSEYLLCINQASIHMKYAISCFEILNLFETIEWEFTSNFSLFFNKFRTGLKQDFCNKIMCEQDLILCSKVETENVEIQRSCRNIISLRISNPNIHDILSSIYNVYYMLVFKSTAHVSLGFFGRVNLDVWNVPAIQAIKGPFCNPNMIFLWHSSVDI